MDGDPVDLSGAIWPLGVPIGHSWREIGCILRIIHTYEIRTVVEVGVDQGGLAVLLQAHRQINSYTGFEIDAKRIMPGVAGIIVIDAWSDDALRLADDMVRATSDHALIYCDGGDKAKEMSLYHRLLRPGDVIGTHDLGSEIHETDLPMGDMWTRIQGPWLPNTRQAFLLRK